MMSFCRRWLVPLIVPVMLVIAWHIDVRATGTRLVPLPQDPFYAMTKHAVNGLARSAGEALERHNIRVNSVCPGGIRTNIIPPDMGKDLSRISEPSYIADAVLRIITEGGTADNWVAYAEGKEPWPYQWASIRPPAR